MKSSKSAVADIPSGGTRNIKSMWEKGNIVSSSESPAPTVKVSEDGVGGVGWSRLRGERRSLLFSQDVAGIRGNVAGRVGNWKAKPAEVEKTPAPAPEPEPEPEPAPAPAKPAVSPDYSCVLYFTSAFPKPAESHSTCMQYVRKLHTPPSPTVSTSFSPSVVMVSSSPVYITAL